jgi:hypothetical protein
MLTSHIHDFATSETATQKIQKQLIDIFNMELQKRAHWYVLPIIHQEKDFNDTTDQSRNEKSSMSIFLEAAGINKKNMRHGIICPTTFVPIVL